MTLPVKPINEIEEKAQVWADDRILILDADTEEARLASKDELKGDKWDQGDPWQAATVSVGSTCTLAPWSSACVSNSGSSSAAVFNFGIPKWEKWDQGNPWASATVSVWSTTTLDAGCCASVTNTGTTSAAVLNFGIPKGAKWDPWQDWQDGNDWASICAAAFNWNNIDFTDTAGCVTTLCNAKTCLKWEPWQPWEDWAPWQDWEPWEAGASVCAAAFSGNDMVFTRTDSCTFTIVDAKNCLKWDQWAPWEDWEPWPAGNGICCVTATKSWKTTTVCMEYTNLAPTVFCVQDWADGQGSGDMSASTYDPSGCMSDAFNYCNFYNTPTIPTDNCQLANWCGYTTCTWTLVASDLTPYAKTANLCAVSTSWKYCDLTWQPTIPTDNCQLGNSCWFTTCTGTLVASDLNGYATTASLCTVATSGKYCDLTGTPALCTVATSGKYCDLSWTPTIPTNNCELANWCWYTTCTGTLTSSDLACYACCCDIPTDNCQLTNGCWYTTCTWTITWICMNWASCGTSGVVDLGIVWWITKIFELASTSDLTTAQAAYDWLRNWGVPIIKYSNTIYYVMSSSINSSQFTLYWICHSSFNRSGSNWNRQYDYSLSFDISNYIVTSISWFNKIIKTASTAPTSWDNNTITFVV